MMKFDAFGNDSQVVSIGGLTIENDNNSIAIYGDLTIDKDDGYQKIKQLATICEQILTACNQPSSQVSLDVADIDMADNPFF